MKRLLALVIALLAVHPGVAAAQKCVAPPGTAAVDEYCETVPSATGDRTGGAGPHRISDGDLSRLAASGADGREAAQALAGEADVERVSRAEQVTRQREGSKRGRDARAGRPGRPVVISDDGDPLSAVVSAAGNGPEVGGALVYGLLALTIALLGAAWVRLRRSGS